MRDINNLLDNLTHNEKYVLMWLLEQLIKSKGYNVSFKVKETAEYVHVCEVTVRETLKKFAITESIKWKRISGNKINIWVTSRVTFHKLVKEWGGDNA